MNTTSSNKAFKINGKFYRYGVAESDGYRPLVPCGPNGGKVDRCHCCGGHADHTVGIECGLG